MSARTQRSNNVQVKPLRRNTGRPRETALSAIVEPKRVLGLLLYFAREAPSVVWDKGTGRATTVRQRPGARPRGSPPGWGSSDGTAGGCGRSAMPAWRSAALRHRCRSDRDKCARNQNPRKIQTKWKSLQPPQRFHQLRFVLFWPFATIRATLGMLIPSSAAISRYFLPCSRSASTRS